MQKDVPAPTASAAAATASAIVPSAPVPSLSALSTSAPSAAGPVESAQVAPQIPEQIANELGQAGIAISAASFRNLGLDRGLLLRGVGNLAAHTSALGFVLNSDAVIAPFMARPDLKLDCADENAMRSVLEYALARPATQQLLANPQAITALVESKLARAIEACPAFRQLSADPTTLSRMAQDNPAIASTLNTPAVQKGLSEAHIKQTPSGFVSAVRTAPAQPASAVRKGAKAQPLPPRKLSK